MALVTAGFELTVNVTDTSGNVSTLKYNLTAGTYATAAADAVIVTDALAAVTNSTISSYRVVERFDENAFTLPANAENAIKAEISAFLEGTPNKRASFRIPAPVVGIFTDASGAGYNIVDTSDALVLAYAALFEDGTGQATISDGETLVAPVSNALDGGRRVSIYSRNP